jgi:hypothetical protein
MGGIVSPSIVDSEENTFFDGSTAPTTPEGSLSISPVLRPKNPESLDGDTTDLDARLQANSRSISSTLLDSRSTLRMPQVRSICCVGAGYVGMSVRLMVPSLEGVVANPNGRRPKGNCPFAEEFSTAAASPGL